jgi:hypothetical protein
MRGAEPKTESVDMMTMAARSSIVATMSNAEIITERDERTGRFLTGGKPGPGRPVGSRNRLAESFVAALKEIWETHGISALQAVARDDPGTLIKVVASLMPRDLNLNVGISAETFVAATAPPVAKSACDRAWRSVRRISPRS